MLGFEKLDALYSASAASVKERILGVHKSKDFNMVDFAISQAHEYAGTSTEIAAVPERQRSRPGPSAWEFSFSAVALMWARLSQPVGHSDPVARRESG